MTKKELALILEKHAKWLRDEEGGELANLSRANLSRADLFGANLFGANLSGANLSGANLSGADLSRADLSRADLSWADLSRADLSRADLSRADLSRADLSGADLSRADLSRADLSRADLSGADLSGANLSRANLSGADMKDVKNIVKIMGCECGNSYWKRFDEGLCNNGYQFYIGLNKLYPGEEFAADERVLCSHPGFHFASRSWCAREYPCRPLEAKIRIPEGATINEPWATDGKASADMIEVLQVFDTKTGEDVTKQYVRPKAKKAKAKK